MQTILLITSNNGDDCLAWSMTSDITFSLASTYQQLTYFANHNIHLLYKLIWSWKGPFRIQCFLLSYAVHPYQYQLTRSLVRATHELVKLNHPSSISQMISTWRCFWDQITSKLKNDQYKPQNNKIGRVW